MKYKRKIRNVILSLCLFLFLYACGEGAVSEDAVTPENKKPFADAGSNQSISINGSDSKIVTLVGTSKDSDGKIVSHQWGQTGGPVVTLTGNNKQSTTVTIPASTETYSFNYTVTDDDGAQDNDEVLVTATRIIFTDSFENDSGWRTVWTTENDTEKADEWLENEGQLLQQANVQEINLSYQKGTYALLEYPPEPLPDSYRFSVDITPLPNDGTGDTEGNDIGIMFRYFDANNYYRVSMNARYGYTRFEKCKSGSFHTLGVNAIGYIENQPVTMTADVDGNKIVILIDGDPVFAIIDSDTPKGTVALYCQNRVKFDNVQILENPKQPIIAISSPLAYSVALTPSDGNTLYAKALVMDKPVDAKVFFSLDDGSPIAAVESNGIFSTEFTNVSVGNHELVAILEDNSGNEIDTDINSTIGVGGDYYITIGDSITNGEGDRFSGNNETNDGRILGIQGYQAVLADSLSVSTGRPQIIFNEGVGGDKAYDLNNRINSILKRHPNANKVLMMIGTNDSAMGVTADNYESMVRSTTNVIDNVYGKTVWIAKPPPTYIKDTWTLDADRNEIIGQYNQKIMGIVEADPYDNTYLGPNFYKTITTTYYFDDYLHPNDAGYQFMANEWEKKLP